MLVDLLDVSALDGRGGDSADVGILRSLVFSSLAIEAGETGGT